MEPHMRASAALLVFGSLLFTTAGHAGSVLDRVRHDGFVRCGAEFRPGLVYVGTDGQAAGLLVDVCRAIAAAAIGPEGRFEFYEYESPNSYGAVRDDEHDVFFLTASELIEQGLTGKVVPGPTVFYETTAVMVRESSAPACGRSRRTTDLLSDGRQRHRHIEAWFASHHLDFIRMGYQEQVEMDDAYNVQVCKGLAGEITSLALMRLDGGVNDLNSRILPEPLAAFPIMAATGTTDAEWSAIVAWTVHTIIAGETPTTEWAAGGAVSLPVEAPRTAVAQRLAEARDRRGRGITATSIAATLGRSRPTTCRADSTRRGRKAELCCLLMRNRPFGNS